MGKKCPVCNSTRIDTTDNSLACKKCGYVNKNFSSNNNKIGKVMEEVA